MIDTLGPGIPSLQKALSASYPGTHLQYPKLWLWSQ